MKYNLWKDNRGFSSLFYTGVLFTTIGLLFFILGWAVVLPDLQRDPDARFIFCMCVGLGGLAIVVGLGMLIAEFRVGNKKQKLMKIGRVFKMPITRIVIDNTTRVNGVPSHKVVCTSSEFLEDAMQQYTSHTVYEYLHDRMSEGDIVTVYVDPANVQNYYVDLDEVECAPSQVYEQQPMYGPQSMYEQQPMYGQSATAFDSKTETSNEQVDKPSTGGFKLRLDDDKTYS